MTRRRNLVAILICFGVIMALRADSRAETVRFDTADGFALTAELWRAQDPKAPVAILLHQFNLDRKSFGPLVPALEAKGFTVLALDQRGQGASTTQKTASGEKTVRIRELPQDRLAPMIEAGPGDVDAAVAYLAKEDIDTNRIVLIGSSYGCTVSLLTAAREKRVRGVALLSPGAAYFGADALIAAKAYAGPLFAIAAEDDPVKSSPPGTRAIGEAHEGPEEIRVLPKGGHGVALLTAHPGLAAEIATFLNQAVSSP